MSNKSLLSFVLFFLYQSGLYSQDIKKEAWPAYWITLEGLRYDEFAVLHFAKDFDLEAKPDKYIAHVSADNRYKLYVNGQYVGNGPARGDEDNWRYETYDLAPFLKKGKNQIRAAVWNFGPYRPVFQHGNGTELIIRGDGANETVINTDTSYFVQAIGSYQPLPVNVRSYYVVGPGEIFDARSFPHDWLKADANSGSYARARMVARGMPQSAISAYGGRPNKVLIPRNIPAMEEKTEAFSSLRNPDKKIEFPMVIPANSSKSFLFDQSYLTTAYPLLQFHGGKGATINLTYAESLIDSSGQKGNRSLVDGKRIFGNRDSIICQGGAATITYMPLWWRTFRYVQMDVISQDEPLILDGFSNIFTGYPLEEKASFSSSYPMTDEIWEVGWRTQRLCAGENFFDCPYYEQLQYVGDTRIQNLITRYVSGDTSLMRNAILSYADSHLASGLTQSRYPSYDRQIIPPFSLIWVYMVHDYFTLCQDETWIKNLLPKMQDVLNWFESRRREDGLNGTLEYWNFVDWVPSWRGGIPPGAKDGGSSIISLQYALALQKMAQMYRHYGIIKSADECLLKAKEIGSQVMALCYDSERGLIADTPEKNSFSQHQNVLAILTGAVKNNQARQLMDKLLEDKQVIPTTFYFSFYLFEAMYQLGGSELMQDHLASWETMIQNGLTTFAEKPDPTRSDCHAWSASPLYFYLSGICGIRPDGPGFKKVKILPALGSLSFAEGSMPHRNGTIKTVFRKAGGKLSGTIELPPGLEGTAVLNGSEVALKPGVNSF